MNASTLLSMAAFTGTALAAVVSIKRRPNFPYHDDNTLTKKEQVLALRKTHFSSSLSISYANSDPLMILKGVGSRLIDETGTAYLDTRNNVAHCGHCHPHVVQAIREQVGVLNTNTRYLHPGIVRLAHRLVQTLPDPLQVVFFVNSGSEANDLALRLARAYSGGSHNTIVVAGGYHGHTIGCLEVSPYKYERGAEFPTVAARQGRSPGEHIWKVPAPDTYRGEYRDKSTAGKKYAEYVRVACRYYTQKGEKVRAFIVEGGMSVAGVILPPPGYLRASVQAVHEAGGLYMADEVQTGFGRLGTSFWAFQASADGVVPDIVTMGKPFGNGMPLAAVVTSRKVAQSFEDCGVEYFNTFGGNPVCAAAGNAVLDVLENENLQAKANQVGNYLIGRFRELQKRLFLIGDVRGSGLFLGVELVRDLHTLEPASAETSFVCSILKSKYHILTSIDGPNENVLVIKPPMVFSTNDADELVHCFELAVVEDLKMVDLAQLSKTPT